MSTVSCLPHDLKSYLKILISFYDMLEGLLEYRHKKRKSAGEMLDHEFVQFHRAAFTVEQIAMQANQGDDKATDLPSMNVPFSMGKTTSVSLRGSVGRHSLFLDYQKYQRSLTTLLATLLNKKELAQLMQAITAFLSKDGEAKDGSELTKSSEEKFSSKLDIIHVQELKQLVKEQKHDQVYVIHFSNLDAFSLF